MDNKKTEIFVDGKKVTEAELKQLKEKLKPGEELKLTESSDSGSQNYRLIKLLYS